MLSLSSKYALRALMCLARDRKQDFTPVDMLSKKADVPGPYLSKLVKTLAQKKLVQTRRGLTGGVRLSPKIKSLSFYDVCVALEDPVVNQSCVLSRKLCGGRTPCALHREWAKTRERILRFLKNARII